MARRALFALSCSFVFLLCPLMLLGQATGSFSGTVSDKTGSVISGANVKVTSQSTGGVREAKTDDSGHYLISLLPVSVYTIQVESQGFQTTEQKDVKLQTDEHPEVNFTLVPGNVSENVEVTASEVVVETTNPSLGQVITSQQVAELPLNGRDFVQLATLTPGTTQETNPGSFFNGGPSSEVSARGSFSLSVGGSRASSTDWLLDGNDNNELTAGGIAILPSIDAIQEFKVLTYNYSAQYGTRAGPTVLVTTKSGSNQIHGSLFEFFRNTDLDARSYFASTREQFNLNQFGGAVGGAIKKDKTFFFLDYQAKMQRHGTPFVGLVPTKDMRGGDYTLDPYGVAARGATNPNGFGDLVNPYTGTPFECDGAGVAIPAGPTGVQTGGTACNKIPTNLFDPVGMQMINLYPLPNASNPGAGFNYADVPVRKLNEGEFDVRLDHNFSSKDSLFARFSYDQATSFVPGGAPGFAEQNAFASSQNIDNHGRNATISETHVFSDRTINQFQVGFNRIFNSILSFGDRSCESARLGIQGANLSGACDSFTGLPPSLTQSTTDCVSCGLSSTQLAGGYYSLGDRGFAPFQGGTNVFSASDSWNTTRGNHSISIGGSVRANQMNVLTNGFQDGFFLYFGGSGFNTYTQDSTADLLLGQVSGSIHDQTFDGATTGRRWKLFRPYVEDNWRITKNLTANIGVAWALVTPVTEAGNRQANFDFATGQFLIPGQNSNGRVGVELDKTAFEPRIGLSWKPFGNDSTAVRAGYAIFHDSSWNQGAQGLWQNPPFYAESDNFSGLCPVGNAASATPLNCGLARSFLPVFTAPPDPFQFQGTIQSQNTNFKQGRVQQFNLNIEHQLPGNLVLTVGYAGSRSSHILVDGVNLNVTSPTACDPASGNFHANYHLGCGQPNIPWGPPTFPNGAPVIDNITDSGSARYDSLQVKAETKSSKHGLYALLSYTYARALDSGFPDGVGTSTGATYWPLPGTQKADWALSQIDLKHNLSASVIYDLPFGKGKQFGSGWNGITNSVLGNWEVDVIEKVTSGFPVFVFDSSNNSGVGFNAGGNSFTRPDQVCDPKASDPRLSKFFNTQCFVPAAMGELGNASRTPVYGPDFVNTDISAIKHFILPYREGMQLDFRAEFFNLFNHAQFGSPTADIESPQFGQINTTVNNPRVMQFALKLNF